MSEVRSVHLQLKTSTFSILDKSEKHFRKNMSAKTICLDATKIEKISRTDNRERRCPTSLLSLSSLSSLSRLLLSLDIGAEGAQGGALPQAPPLSKAGVWGGM